MEMDDSSGLKFEFQGFRLLPIKCSTERLQQIFLIFFLGALCAFAARPVEYRLDQDQVVRPKRYSTGTVIVYPIFSSSRQACPEQSRRDAKTAKKNTFLFLRTWRPLRLCESHRLSDLLLTAPSLS